MPCWGHKVRVVAYTVVGDRILQYLIQLTTNEK